MFKIAVIGAGPSGLYLCSRLIKKLPNSIIDIFERRSEPFGLLRFGVAPDNLTIRQSVKQFDTLLSNPNVNLKLSSTVTEDKLSSLTQGYDAICVCTGTQVARTLDIPGEYNERYFLSSEIVGWYNQNPEFSHISLDLDRIERVAILGQGNVSLDVARLFLKKKEQLAGLDKDVVLALQKSRIKEIDIIGRRGPAEAAFTSAELREIFSMDNVSIESEPDRSRICEELRHLGPDLAKDRRRSRLAKLMLDKLSSDQKGSESNKILRFRFYTRPVEILNDQNEIKLRVEAEKQKLIPYDMVISCIGYTHQKPLTFPLSSRDLVTNVSEKTRPKVYVSGWASTGSSGNLSTTMTDSYKVADEIINDLKIKKHLD